MRSVPSPRVASRVSAREGCLAIVLRVGIPKRAERLTRRERNRVQSASKWGWRGLRGAVRCALVFEFIFRLVFPSLLPKEGEWKGLLALQDLGSKPFERRGGPRTSSERVGASAPNPFALVASKRGHAATTRAAFNCIGSFALASSEARPIPRVGRRGATAETALQSGCVPAREQAKAERLLQRYAAGHGHSVGTQSGAPEQRAEKSAAGAPLRMRECERNE